ncbi:MAG: rod shape-determining protein [Lachnospiraceae bacterium]|nr:rod shape-determining protein [Lachnospiraceae bacterium]
MGTKVIGIDLGTKVLKLYRKNDGIIYDEQNVIAIEDGKKILAIGDEAAEMSEKAPEGIEVVYPVTNGIIADAGKMIKMFNKIFEKLYGAPKKAHKPRFIIAIPTDITEVDKRSFVDLIMSSDLKSNKVSLVDKPICVALGAGLDVTNARGIMTVDIGADTTEVSILSLGGIVLSKLINVGGNDIDESIKLYVKKNYNLYIGSKTAEKIKKELACAVPLSEVKTIKVYGRDVVKGLPIEAEISSTMVYEAIENHFGAIVDAVRTILERTPPEISSDIIDSGIYITGGSANIKDIDKLFNQKTDLKINIIPDPDNSVVKGLGKIMDEDKFETLPYVYHQTNYSIRMKD